MATHKLDALGLKCPQPVLKISAKSVELQPGDILEVTADCSTFEDDVRKWCQRMNKTLLAIVPAGLGKKATIKF